MFKLCLCMIAYAYIYISTQIAMYPPLPRIGVPHSFSEAYAFAASTSVATKNGSIFTAYWNDTDSINALFLARCTLACLHLVCVG